MSFIVLSSKNKFLCVEGEGGAMIFFLRTKIFLPFFLKRIYFI